MRVVQAYRNAAIKQFGITQEEARRANVSPKDDKGEWAPESLAVLYLEHVALYQMNYYSPYFLDRCVELSDRAGIGYIECINPAVCAVYP